MSAHPTFDLKFTSELRFRIETFLGSITEYEPTLVLMKDTSERWSFAAYGPQNIEFVGPELERIGERLLFIADGMLVAIPQFQFLDELAGKTLASGENGLKIMSR